MSVVFQTNNDIHLARMRDVCNLITSLSYQLRDTENPLPAEVRTSCEATLIRAYNRLDNILDNDKHWAPPSIDLQDCVGVKLDLDNRIQNHTLLALELQRQTVLAQLQPQPPIPDAEVISEQPSTIRRKKKSKNK
jgi:hypothetical protein